MSKSDGMGASEMLAPIIITYECPAGRWSAATSVGLLFYGVSRVEAEARLTYAGITTELISCDPLTWRSTLTAAFASEIEAINSTLESLPQSSEVEAVRSRAELIETNLAALSASVAAEQRRREIEAGEIELNRRAEATFAQVGGRDNPVTVATVWASMWNSKLGRRIKELRNQ